MTPRKAISRSINSNGLGRHKSLTHIKHHAGAVGREDLVHEIPVLTPEYLLPSQWVPVLGPTCLLSRRTAGIGVHIDFLPRWSQSPSLLISGSGSWPQREGLLSPAARQIYRRNFPPVGFIQSRTVLLMRRQSNPITPHETWLELFWSKFDFVLSLVFEYKALVGVLSSSIWVLYQGRIFLAATDRKNITDLFCFERAHFIVFYILFFFHGVCKPCNEPETSGDWTHKYHKTALLFITVFCIEHSFI